MLFTFLSICRFWLPTEGSSTLKTSKANYGASKRVIAWEIPLAKNPSPCIIAIMITGCIAHSHPQTALGRSSLLLRRRAQ